MKNGVLIGYLLGFLGGLSLCSIPIRHLEADLKKAEIMASICWSGNYK